MFSSGTGWWKAIIGDVKRGIEDKSLGGEAGEKANKRHLPEDNPKRTFDAEPVNRRAVGCDPGGNAIAAVDIL